MSACSRCTDQPAHWNAVWLITNGTINSEWRKAPICLDCVEEVRQEGNFVRLEELPERVTRARRVRRFNQAQVKKALLAPENEMFPDAK